MRTSKYGESDAYVRESNTLSWKPCQGDSLNLPDHRTSRWRNYHIPAESQSRPHAHTQSSRIHSKASIKT
ncbi:hypothetical protein Tco_0700193 [Tanacetum coccineum]